MLPLVATALASPLALEAQAEPAALEPDPAGPTTQRYLLAPGASTLGRGNAAVSLRELLPVATYGVTDGWDLSLGLPWRARSALFGTKLAFPLGDQARVALGVGAAIGRESTLVVPYGSATWGDTERSVSVVGSAIAGSVDAQRPGRAEPSSFVGGALGVAGSQPLGQRWRALGEAWLLVDSPEPLFVLAGGARYARGRFSLDLGLLALVDAGEYPLPWLDLTWRWGPDYRRGG